MNVSTIVKQVRILLDYNEDMDTLEGFTGDYDTLKLDDIITNQIEKAARLVEENAPEKWCDWDKVTEGGTLSVSDNVYRLPLSVDYIRLGRCKLSDWKYSVSEFLPTFSKEYKKQWSEFSGLHASVDRPRAFVQDGDYASGVYHTIEMFGVKESTTLSYLTYCKQPTLSTDGSTITINAMLEQPLIYMTAALTAEVLKDSNKASKMMAYSNEVLENNQVTTPQAQDVNE